MEEQLISFETAISAKEKGFFNGGLRDYYDIKGNLIYKDNHNKFISYDISAPTQSLLQKWLRERHKIYILVYVMEDSDGSIYFDYGLKQIVNWLSDKSCEPNMFKTYEEALEFGLKEALKLI